MKTIFLSIIIVLILAPLIFNSADAELDKSLREPFENNDLVIIGKVIHVNSIVSENKTEYNIQVEEYLKGQKPFDMITAILDDVRPADFPNYPMDFPNSNPLDYYNKPFFEEGNLVFAYLKQDGGTFKMSPYSFTIKKKSVAGPPTVIIPTDPQGHFISQGDEIIISGVIKKGYLYDLGKNEIDSSFHISILNEKEKQVESEKLTLSPDGSYKFAFQSKDEFRIPGNYSWEITYWNGGMGGEFVIVPDFDRWSPLKQFKSGILFSEIKCNGNLQLTQRYDGTPACVKDRTVFELIKRGWTSDIIRLVQSRDVFLDPKDAASSYMDRVTPTLDDFKNTLSEPYDIDEIFSKFGEPHDDIGSGIHIYVYELNDSTEIWIGYVDDIWYVKHVDVDGNVVEDLFAKNEN